MIKKKKQQEYLPKVRRVLHRTNRGDYVEPYTARCIDSAHNAGIGIVYELDRKFIDSLFVR